MKIEEIRELAALLESSQLNVLEVKEGDSSLRLEKAAPVIQTIQTVPGVQTAPGVQAAPGVQGIPVVQAADAGGADQALGTPVKCPMVGVFYSAPAPGEEPFVTVGSRVEKGDVLCIVEAMKLMNEITAETAGEVTKICAGDGEVVEFGEPLFYIK